MTAEIVLNVQVKGGSVGSGIAPPEWLYRPHNFGVHWVVFALLPGFPM